MFRAPRDPDLGLALRWPGQYGEWDRSTWNKPDSLPGGRRSAGDQFQVPPVEVLTGTRCISWSVLAVGIMLDSATA